MALYAWTQDVPIDEAAYRDITSRLPAGSLPGCLAHIAIRLPEGNLRYIDVWESEAACDAAFETYIHPAVGPVLHERGIQVDGEPPRHLLDVIDLVVPGVAAPV
jgi:hypothetical protein